MTLQIALILPGSSTASASSTATLPPAVISRIPCRCSFVLLLCGWTLLHFGPGYFGSGLFCPGRWGLDGLAILARGWLRGGGRASRGGSAGFGARLGRRGRARR